MVILLLEFLLVANVPAKGSVLPTGEDIWRFVWKGRRRGGTLKRDLKSQPKSLNIREV